MVEARALYRAAKEQLEKACIADAAFEAGLLLQKATGFCRFDTDLVDEKAAASLEEAIGRRLAREPLQYILGEWEFMGLPLAVGTGVLVPRPETEEVCLAAIQLLKRSGNPRPRVLDLCAGSGALALGIQQAFPKAGVRAVEWDEAAFAYCKKNCDAYAPAARGNAPRAVLADALTYYKELERESLDLIVSNPPYVTAAEYESLAPELYHEPKQALVAGENGLLFYRHIARRYKKIVKPGAALVFEIGAAQGEAVQSILAENGYQAIEIKKDINGNPRIALGIKPQ